jgi:hypothetical protein
VGPNQSKTRVSYLPEIAYVTSVLSLNI